MRLQLLLTTIVHVAVVESLGDTLAVTGYLGDNVTLPSGADPSWELSKIEWSVFSNNTWIATFRDGKLNIKRFHLYIDRLHLNTSSGDLMIQNLNREDAIEYRVELISTDGQNSVKKISLDVTERLKPPTIRHITYESKGGCWTELRCSSPDNRVDISWRVEPSNVTFYSLNDSAALCVFLNRTENSVKFICTARNRMDSATADIITKCNDEQPQHKKQSEYRCTYTPFFFLGFFLGATLAAILTYWFKEQIKTVWEYIKAKLFPSESSC